MPRGHTQQKKKKKMWWHTFFWLMCRTVIALTEVMVWKQWWYFHCNSHTHQIRKSKTEQIQKPLYKTIMIVEWLFRNCYGMYRSDDLEILMRLSLQLPYSQHHTIKNSPNSKTSLQFSYTIKFKNPIAGLKNAWEPWFVHMHFVCLCLCFDMIADFCWFLEIANQKIFFEGAPSQRPNVISSRVRIYLNKN